MNPVGSVAVAHPGLSRGKFSRLTVYVGHLKSPSPLLFMIKLTRHLVVTRCCHPERSSALQNEVEGSRRDSPPDQNDIFAEVAQW